jgi:hypothetical protein
MVVGSDGHAVVSNRTQRTGRKYVDHEFTRLGTGSDNLVALDRNLDFLISSYVLLTAIEGRARPTHLVIKRVNLNTIRNSKNQLDSSSIARIVVRDIKTR